MVKKTKEEVKTKSIAEIESENKRLRETIEAMSQVSPSVGSHVNRYLKEIDSIRKKARVDTDKIKVEEITDHKNISLWTPEGKRIGPLHRDNALATLRRFFDLGITLSSVQPTPEEIEAYKQTAEYKSAQEALAKSRAIKEKSRKSGQIEKLAKEIAKMSGTTVEAINSILKSNQVKSLSEGRASTGAS